MSVPELDRAETEFGLRFSPIWRSVLGQVHPVALTKPPRSTDGVLRWTAYPDWRMRDRAGTQALIDNPLEGLLGDVEYNGVLVEGVGVPPQDLAQRLKVARGRLSEVPTLTPLWGHQYVAETDDSPVFSIVQADLYIPALSVLDLMNGAGQESVGVDDFPIGHVPFWSDLHGYSQIGHISSFGLLARGGL